MRAIILSLFLAFLGASTAGAQDATPHLALSTTAPAVDGVVKPGEYSFTKDSGDLVLSVNRTASVLSLAVVGQTGGWVGVGVGALEMNGATIFMGFVDDAGQASFKPQAGEPGHTHTDAAASVMDTVISWAMRQTGNTTTLEVALKPDASITKDSRTLDVIYAIGPDDGFTEYHLDRDFVSLNLDSP